MAQAGTRARLVHVTVAPKSMPTASPEEPRDFEAASRGYLPSARTGDIRGAARDSPWNEPATVGSSIVPPAPRRDADQILSSLALSSVRSFTTSPVFTLDAALNIIR